MKKICALIAICVACFACASTTTIKQKDITYIAESTVFSFKYGHETKNVNQYVAKQLPIYEAIVHTVIDASYFPKKSLIKANTNKLSYVKGLSINQVSNGLEVLYLNGEHYHGLGMESVTSVKAFYQLEWQDFPSHVTLNITFPNKLEIDYERDGVFQRIEPLSSLESIENDVIRINNALVSELMKLESKNI